MTASVRAGFAYAALSIGLTWPLAAHLGTVLPIGGDNVHLAWVLAWISHAAFRSPGELFDGNIFHPANDAIAFSDPNVSSGLLVAPALMLGANPTVAVNLLFLGSFVLCALACRALVLEWTGTESAAFAAGVFFAFAPTRFAHVDHVQLYAFWWTPIALLGLDRFLRGGGNRPLALATAAIVAEAYASLYLATFAVTAILLLWLVAMATKRSAISFRQALPPVVAATAAGAVALAPLAAALLELRRVWAPVRSLEQNVRYAASPFAYLSAAPQSVVWGDWLGRFADASAPWEKYLFPGVVPVFLAAVAVRYQRRCMAVRFGLALALTSAILSLGPYLRGGWPLPYLAVYSFVPPLKALRVPARFGLLASLGLAITAAIGLAQLPRRWRAGILACALAEAWVFPLPTRRSPELTIDRPLYEFLSRSGTGALLELPLPRNEDEAREVEPPRLYASTLHWRRIANGYSGYAPPSYRGLTELTATEPVERVLPVLAAWGIRTIVIHPNEWGIDQGEDWKNLGEHGGVRETFSDGEARVFEIDATPSVFRPMTAHVVASNPLPSDRRLSLDVEVAAAAVPIAAPPAMFGWHRTQVEWDRSDGFHVRLWAKYFCAPIIYAGVRRSSVFVDTPRLEGQYRMRLSSSCVAFDDPVMIERGSS